MDQIEIIEHKRTTFNRTSWEVLIALSVTRHPAWAWFGTLAYDHIRPEICIFTTMTSGVAIDA